MLYLIEAFLVQKKQGFLSDCSSELNILDWGSLQVASNNLKTSFDLLIMKDFKYDLNMVFEEERFRFRV